MSKHHPRRDEEMATATERTQQQGPTWREGERYPLAARVNTNAVRTRFQRMQERGVLVQQRNTSGRQK